MINPWPDITSDENGLPQWRINSDFADYLVKMLTANEREILQILLDNGVHSAVKAERKEFEYYAWDSDAMREFGSEMHSIIQWI